MSEDLKCICNDGEGEFGPPCPKCMADFTAFLEKASQTVAKWPEWKRNLLGRTGTNLSESLVNLVLSWKARVDRKDTSYPKESLISDVEKNIDYHVGRRTEKLKSLLKDALVAVRNEAQACDGITRHGVLSPELEKACVEEASKWFDLLERIEEATK